MKKSILIAIAIFSIVYLSLNYCTNTKTVGNKPEDNNRIWHTRDSITIEAYKKAGRIKIVKDFINKAP